MDNDKKKKNVISMIIIAILFILILFIIKLKVDTKEQNIKNENNLIGSWTTDGVTVYEFEDNGNGTLKLPLRECAFTYKIEGNKMFIDFDSKDTRDSNYEYFFKEETLVLKGIKGTTGEYTFYRK